MVNSTTSHQTVGSIPHYVTQHRAAIAPSAQPKTLARKFASKNSVLTDAQRLRAAARHALRAASLMEQSTPNVVIDVLRQIVIETMDYPPARPYSTDSYLPAHLIEFAQQALAAYGRRVRPDASMMASGGAA